MGGCASGQTAAEEPRTAPAEVPAVVVEPAELQFSESAANLTFETDGQTVVVGDAMDKVALLFPKPARAFPIADLPEGFSSQFDMRGWEMAATSIGFIGARGRLALILEILDRADEDMIQNRVARAAEASGPFSETVTVGSIRYWFWETQGARKMICASPDEGGRLSLTTALGHPKLMTALRMNRELAEQDAVAAQKLLNDAAAQRPQTPPPAAEPNPDAPASL